MKKLRKFLTVSVMVLTVVFTSGALSINSAKAAASTGDLIKMAGNASVYYLGADGKRYVFPNSTTYFSWYSDFSGVVTIPAAELQSYPLGGNVTMRPGTKLVKITTDPKVYAVEPNGVLRGIQTEAQAAALYGTDWNKRVVDVPDAFFTNYTTGAALATGATPAGSLVKNAGSASIYYYDGSSYRSITNEAAMMANRFQMANVLTISNTITAGGNSISSAEFVNVAQGGNLGGTVITGSGLMVSLSASTPAAASVPQNGARVPMAKVNLTAANDGAVTVNSITVKRIGLSTYSQIDKVWAEKDGVIVASKKSMNSNDESILTFSPALTVNAGQTVSLDFIVSLTSASGNIGLGIASASAISATSASVTGSFPINSNLMSPTSYSVVNLGLTSTTTTATTVKVGDEKVELGKFTVDFNTLVGGTSASAAKDVTLKSIMIKNNGTEDLSSATMDLYLENAGNKVSVNTVVSDRYVTFYFPSTGFDVLKDDASKIFYIKGNIISKDIAGTGSLVFVLNKSTDLVGYEKATGFGVNVYNEITVGATAADAFAISTVDIDAGKLSVSKKSTSPSDTTIVKGTDNLMLLANVHADEAIVADGLKIKYTTGTAASTTDQFELVRVYLNGVLLDSFDPSVSTSSDLYATIDSTLNLVKGDNEVKVTAKAKTNATNGAAIKFVLDTTMFDGQNAEYVVSGNTVSTTDLGNMGSATGALFTVATAVLTTVKSDGYSDNKVIVQGSTDVSLGKFTLKATNDDIKVTSITLGANIGSTSATNINDMKLFVDGSQVGSTVDFGSTGSTFSSLNFTIAKDSTKAIELKGSFDSSATGTFQTLMTVNAQDAARGTAITSGNLATSTLFATASSGSLNVELGGNTPASAILASKATEQEVAQFKFTAVNDSADLTEINVINDSDASTPNTATSSADARIASIKLYDGATLIDSFVPVSGAGKFTISSGEVKIDANLSKTLSVKVVLNNIDNDVNATNKDIKLSFTSVKAKSSSGAEYTSASTNVDANSFRVRKTVPTVALAALPATLLTAGDAVISKFTVTADSNGDVTLKKIVLTVATSTATVTPMAAGTAVRVNGSMKALASSTLVGTLMTLDFADSAVEVISAGTTKTFEVYGNISGTIDTGSSVSTKISEPTSYTAASSFEWSDGASVSTPTYSNGYKVPGVTTMTQTMSK
ncbi:MAG: hypothetical protein WCT09_00180 [Patescibacteria group bacterium]